MADPPWRGRKLTPGQVAQRLTSLGCTRVGERLPDAELWRTPNGHAFWISLEEVDAEFLEGMVEQIERWINKKK